MFSWSDGPGNLSVSTVDYVSLDQDNLLNDTIIDFYIRYVFSTKLSDELKNKCHVFFFILLPKPKYEVEDRKVFISFHCLNAYAIQCLLYLTFFFSSGNTQSKMMSNYLRQKEGTQE